MITNYGQERTVGEVWIDSIDGAKVITVPVMGARTVPLPPLPVVPALVPSMTVTPAVPLIAQMGGMSISS